ncbi:MAG: serine/threonine protein kinase, partial [Streptomyces sp.]|nr:serine/threonine protein kinase [Streptomyces sp.]
MSGDGVVAGRYRLAGRLGRGGMGTVWAATDELLHREVAVKELHLADGESAQQLDRALREARGLARIRHPNVVVVHDVVEQDGRPWIVMELVDGRSLADVLREDGPLPPREAARVGAAVAGALLAAHEHGIQHRDVKPANVLMDRTSGRVVLTDFGIARVPGSTTISDTGAFVGSPEYTAPERMSGQPAGPESDLWSLGALLCAAVDGRSPFRGESIGEIVHAVAFADISPPAAVGPLMPVVRGLLERDPARRMAAAEVQTVLIAYAETGVEPPTPPTPATLPTAPVPDAATAKLPEDGQPP